MIKCICERVLYTPGEVKKDLNISGTALTKFREDFWLPGQWHTVGFLYRGEDVEILRKELYRRRNKNVMEVSTDDTAN